MNLNAVGAMTLDSNAAATFAGSSVSVDADGGDIGLQVSTGNEVVVNEAGTPNVSFRVESDSTSSMLYVSGTANSVGIATSSPDGVNYVLDVNGSARADSWEASSDRRLKKDIKSIDESLSKVTRLRGVTFKWRPVTGKNRDLDKINIGYIAQEVEEVVPEVVTTDGSGYKAVDYAKLTALLTEAIKTQNSQIKELQYAAGFSNELPSDVELKSEINDLKSKIEQITSVVNKQTETINSIIGVMNKQM